MEEVAQVYSRSLFEVAREQGKLDRIRDELAAFADALAQNRELSVFFFSPYFSTQEKEDGLARTYRWIASQLHVREPVRTIAV